MSRTLRAGNGSWGIIWHGGEYADITWSGTPVDALNLWSKVGDQPDQPYTRADLKKMLGGWLDDNRSVLRDYIMSVG